MTDLIDEIREDIKEERYAELWQRYGNYAIAGAIGIIILTAASVWFSSYQQTSSEEVASHYYEISYDINKKPTEEVLAQLDEMHRDDNGTFSALAALKRASLLEQNNNSSDAVSLYKEVADDSSSAAEFRALSNLLYVAARVNGDIKEIDENDINARLEKLTSDASPWQFQAKEIKALLALRLGDKEKAASLFEEISTDFSAPASIRQRASDIAKSISS